MQISEAKESDRKNLSGFYAEQGYHSDWSKFERAFIIMRNRQITGSVKVESSNGVSILRGMYILNEFQGRKLGTKLIKHIEQLLNETVSYCMPFTHLEKFYSQIEFKKTKLNKFPDFLHQRYKEYEKVGFKIIPMVRAIAT